MATSIAPTRSPSTRSPTPPSPLSSSSPCPLPPPLAISTPAARSVATASSASAATASFTSSQPAAPPTAAQGFRAAPGSGSPVLSLSALGHLLLLGRSSGGDTHAPPPPLPSHNPIHDSLDEPFLLPRSSPPPVHASPPTRLPLPARDASSVVTPSEFPPRQPSEATSQGAVDKEVVGGDTARNWRVATQVPPSSADKRAPSSLASEQQGLGGGAADPSAGMAPTHTSPSCLPAAAAPSASPPCPSRVFATMPPRGRTLNRHGSDRRLPAPAPGSHRRPRATTRDATAASAVCPPLAVANAPAVLLAPRGGDAHAATVTPRPDESVAGNGTDSLQVTPKPGSGGPGSDSGCTAPPPSPATPCIVGGSSATTAQPSLVAPAAPPDLQVPIQNADTGGVAERYVVTEAGPPPEVPSAGSATLRAATAALSITAGQRSVTTASTTACSHMPGCEPTGDANPAPTPASGAHAESSALPAAAPWRPPSRDSSGTTSLPNFASPRPLSRDSVAAAVFSAASTGAASSAHTSPTRPPSRGPVRVTLTGTSIPARIIVEATGPVSHGTALPLPTGPFARATFDMGGLAAWACTGEDRGLGVAFAHHGPTPNLTPLVDQDPPPREVAQAPEGRAHLPPVASEAEPVLLASGLSSSPPALSSPPDSGSKVAPPNGSSITLPALAPPPPALVLPAGCRSATGSSALLATLSPPSAWTPAPDAAPSAATTTSSWEGDHSPGEIAAAAASSPSPPARTRTAPVGIANRERHAAGCAPTTVSSPPPVASRAPARRVLTRLARSIAGAVAHAEGIGVDDTTQADSDSTDAAPAPAACALPHAEFERMLDVALLVTALRERRSDGGSVVGTSTDRQALCRSMNEGDGGGSCFGAGNKGTVEGDGRGEGSTAGSECGISPAPAGEPFARQATDGEPPPPGRTELPSPGTEAPASDSDDLTYATSAAAGGHPTQCDAASPVVSNARERLTRRGEAGSAKARTMMALRMARVVDHRIIGERVPEMTSSDAGRLAASMRAGPAARYSAEADMVERRRAPGLRWSARGLGVSCWVVEARNTHHVCFFFPGCSHRAARKASRSLVRAPGAALSFLPATRIHCCLLRGTDVRRVSPHRLTGRTS